MMNYGEAMAYVMLGAGVRRAGWQTQNSPSCCLVRGKVCRTFNGPHMGVVPFVAEISDLSATDWVLAWEPVPPAQRAMP